MKESLLTILPEYLSKQVLVYQAMEKLRPDLLAMATDFEQEKVMSALELSKKYSHVPQRGMLEVEGKKWEYFIHGLGCRLIHHETREPIEWNAPNLDTFHNQWFFNWAKWYFKHHDNEVEVTDETLNATLTDLVNDGKLEEIKSKSGIEFRFNS